MAEEDEIDYESLGSAAPRQLLAFSLPRWLAAGCWLSEANFTFMQLQHADFIDFILLWYIHQFYPSTNNMLNTAITGDPTVMPFRIHTSCSSRCHPLFGLLLSKIQSE